MGMIVDDDGRLVKSNRGLLEGNLLDRGLFM